MLNRLKRRDCRRGVGAATLLLVTACTGGAAPAPAATTSVADASRPSVLAPIHRRDSLPMLIINGLIVRWPADTSSDAWRDSILASVRGQRVEAITLLPGREASALYGSRAGAGALLLDTRPDP
jgi:hypothetical protein